MSQDQVEGIRISDVAPIDVEELHKMIVESTDGNTKITSSQLRRDLFDNLAPLVDDFPVDIPRDAASSDTTACKVLMIKAGEKSLGYLMYTYYYTPWNGRFIYVLDIYTIPQSRRKGLAKRLMKYLAKLGEKEALSGFLFDTSRLSKSLVDYVKLSGATLVRDDDSDWSVFRIYFNNIRN